MNNQHESNDIINYWFDKSEPDKFRKMWFSSKEDQYIIANFKHSLTLAENKTLEHWKESIDSYVALIVLLDQFSRNIYRNHNYRINDAYALELALEFISKFWNQEITIDKRIFVLMPLRHTFDKKYYEMIFKLTQNNNNDSQIMKKFLKKTNQIYQGI